MTDSFNPKEIERSLLVHHCVQRVAEKIIAGEDATDLQRALEREHSFPLHIFPAYVEMYVQGWRNAMTLLGHNA